ncbi:MAG: hypothetical protein HN576_05575 [Bacteriovoracaceae bacterium]|jgi:hypothetical protein|nr:hypothetical protein [Bacteriovoracaceae bacterium]
MKAVKIIMVFITTFCLLNMQYQAGVVHLSISNDVQAQTNTQNYKAENVYQGEEASQADGFLDQILYLAVGLICAVMIIKAKSSTAYDIIIAAAAGAALIVGELIMMTQNADAVAAMEISYTTDNEGKTYDNAQTEALKTQLEMNKKLKGALTTKAWIQGIAGVALLAATVAAVSIWATALSTGSAGLVLAGVPGSIPPTPVTPNPAYQPTCAAAMGTYASYWATYVIPKPSSADYPSNQALLSTMATCTYFIPFQTYEMASDLYMAVPAATVQNENKFLIDKLQKMAKTNPQALEITKSFMEESYFSDDEKSKFRKELINKTLVNDIHVKSIISSHHPLYEVNIKEDLVAEKNEINRYMRVHESKSVAAGDIKSITLNEFHNFETIYKYDDLNSFDQMTMKDILRTAANKGLDLILPQAKADWMKLLMVVGGVLAGVYLIEATTMDLLFGTAGKRTIVWGVMTAIVAYSLSKTMQGLKATNSNIEKLEKILDNMSKLVDGQEYQIGGTVGGGGADDLGTKPVFGEVNITGPVPVGLDDGQVTPCIGGQNPDGSCQSVATQLQAAESSPGFNFGGALEGSSNLIGQMADGMSGVNNLSAGTIEKMQALGKKRALLSKNRKLALEKLEKMLKKNKLKPFGFNKRVSDFHNKMRATLKSSLTKQGLTPKMAAAKLGIIGSGDDKKVAKEEGVQNREGVAAKSGALTKSTGKKIDFGFGSGTTKNSNAASAGVADFEDPNVTGEKMPEYETDDIALDKSANIFQIISLRYLKSGYQRLRSLKAQNVINN